MAASLNTSGLVDLGLSGGQKTATTSSPLSKKASRAALPKSALPIRAIRMLDHLVVTKSSQFIGSKAQFTENLIGMLTK